MTTTFPTISPDSDAAKERQGKILQAEFSDGYNQTAGDGINPYREEWQMTFSNRRNADVDTIEDFLIARNNVQAFYWTPPGEVTETPQKKWKQKGAYRRTRAGPYTSTIKFTIYRVQGT